MINVLHLVNEFSDCSSNRLIWQIIRGLDLARFRFWVGCVRSRAGSMQPLFEDAHARICHFHVAGTGSRDVVKAICRTLDRSQIHIIHSHVLRPDALGAWAQRRRPHVRLVSTKHNMTYPRGFPQRRLRNLLYWLVMAFPDRIITVTRAQQVQLARIPYLRKKQVVVIPNGIDLPRFFQPVLRERTRVESGLPAKHIVIGYIGRMVPGKGLQIFIDAAARVCAAHVESSFLLVGDGEMQLQLQARVAQLGLTDRILFTGFREDIPALLAAMDIFVLPSRAEGLPLSLMEGMAAGKACVTTTVGGVLELIEPGVEALVIPCGDAGALAEVLLQLLTDRAIIQSLGARAHMKAQQTFSLHSMLQAYDHAYQALVPEESVLVSP